MALGLNSGRAAAALAFHREIEAAVTARLTEHGPEGYTLVPVVGTAQRTLQSAQWSPAGLQCGQSPPNRLEPVLADGDGTVPRVSAIPIELSTAVREITLPQRHSALQNSPVVLADLRNKLIHLQTRGLSAIRGPDAQPFPEPPGFDLDLQDAYLSAEPVTVSARLTDPPLCDGAVRAVVHAVDRSGPGIAIGLVEHDGHWEGVLDRLPVGVYRLTVSTDYQGPGDAHPAQDLFEVVSP